MPCVTSEEELYEEVAANYDDFGIVSKKKPDDVDLELAEVIELNRQTQEIRPSSLLG